MVMFDKTSTQDHAARILAAMAFVAVLAGAIPAAHADPYHHDRDWDLHRRAAYDWRLHHPVLPPGHVYAPPVIVAAPPPPPTGLNLIIPLSIH